MSQPKLNEDLDIIGQSNLEITLLDGDLNIIQALDDEPNDVGGLSAQELKEKFDKAGNIIKEYINGTLIPELLAADATEAARAESEAQREANETVRQENEAVRQAQETARQEDAEALAAELRDGFDELSGQLQDAEEAREVWEDYDPAKAYAPGNKVYYAGSSYVNRVACADILPTNTDYWQLIAKKGADSDEGMSPEEADLRYLQLTGGILSGALAVSGELSVQEPVQDSHAASKGYVDGAVEASLDSGKNYTDLAVQSAVGDIASDSYTREQCLSAEARDVLKLTASETPGDAFLRLAIGAGNYAFSFHVQLSDGTPVTDVTVSGIKSTSGAAVKTDENGDVFGVTTSTSPQITITSPWLDVLDFKQIILSTGVLTRAVITLSECTDSILYIFSSNTKIRFSRAHEATVCCVAGGMNGTAGTAPNTNNGTGNGGSGGAGGKIYNKNVSLQAGTDYPAVVGASNGGVTTFAGASSNSGVNTAYALNDSSLPFGGNGGAGGYGSMRASGASGGAGTDGTRSGGGGGGGGGAGYVGNGWSTAVGIGGTCPNQGATVSVKGVNTSVGGANGANGSAGSSTGSTTSGFQDTGGAGGHGGSGGRGGGGGGGGGGGASYNSSYASGGAAGSGGAGVILIKLLS